MIIKWVMWWKRMRRRSEENAYRLVASGKWQWEWRVGVAVGESSQFITQPTSH